MSSREKNSDQTTTTTTEKQSPVRISILSLPNDLLLSCFARVPRLSYPTLSLVCKRFRSFISSPKLYHRRSLSGRTESFLYLCLSNGYNREPYWFTLCLKPNRTLTDGTKKYALARIPNPPSPEVNHASFVSVGCNIYAIGGPLPSSNVSILDCRFHTWYKAPSMRVKRIYPAANVFDGKIYVAGGCDSSLMEVFNPKTQTWDLVFNPLIETSKKNVYMCKSAVFDGEIYMVDDRNECIAYKPKEDKWEAVEMNLGLSCSSYCVIDNVLYAYRELSEIEWYDPKIRDWRNLMGLERLPDISSFTGPKLVDYDGKMAVFWDEEVAYGGYNNSMICCVVISLERRNNQEIWGKIEWCEDILQVSRDYSCLHALAAKV